MLAGFAEKYGITFSLLSDEGSRVIQVLGMLNEHVQEHHAFYGIPERDYVVGVPYPGTFLLDQQGVVVERRFQDSYRERETGVAILEQGFGIESSAHGPEARAGGAGLAVRAYLDSGVYRGFQRLRLTVELAVESGLHVYGRPIPEGYVPLSVEVAPIEGLDVGPLDGPAPHPFRIEGLDEAFFVHEGPLRFSLPLTFRERVGDQTVQVTVRYQACSATDCLMPQAIELQLPVTMENNLESDR
ncbi:MAG: redoxin domain-containing protein [Chloroflexi bacterium]|nr:redoxin domain-containing protein [Chloroflexota bacterium]